jgi:hypothetical protein
MPDFRDVVVLRTLLCMASYFKNTGSVYQIRRDTGHEPPRRQPVGRKISNAQLTERVKQQILKVIYDPSPGKPMRFCRKQTREETREVYILPFRLSCWFDKQKDTLVSSRSITRMNNKMPEDCAEKNPVP